MEHSFIQKTVSGIYFKEIRGFISPTTTANFISKKEKHPMGKSIKRIPEESASVDVVYSCHMIEHMEREDAESFLKETRRILKSGGTIRIAVPNIRFHAENYLKDGDADKFIEDILLTRKKPKTIIAKVRYLIIGDRNHQWMYDGDSLCQLLSSAGFHKPQVMEAGSTTIAESGALNLKERSPQSVFV